MSAPVTPRQANLARLAVAAFERRHVAGIALAEQADAVAGACHDMARRFQRGGKLIAFGSGPGSTDAQHIAVEFVHPVIVGKRALPATSLTADVATVSGVAAREGWDEVFAHQVRYLARPEDIAIAILAVPGRSALAGLEVAKTMGLLTIALAGRDLPPAATNGAVDHVLAAQAEDRQIIKEMHVTLYHLLWELVHVFLERERSPGAEHGEGRDGSGDAVRSLYPFLYAGPSDLDSMLEQVRHSTEDKARDIAGLRDLVGREMRGRLVDCAQAMARSFESGGKLLAFGNGGSASDAQAVTQLFLHPPGGRPLPALSLTNDTGVITALSNDVGFDVAFSRQIAVFGEAGDIALGLSTSGNSANLLSAFDQASRQGLLGIGFAGYDGGRMAEMRSMDHLFVVPSSSVHRIQEAQTTLYHVLWELTQAALDGGE